jgi:hypothetical protein
MRSVPQTSDLGQITLVDLDGRPIDADDCGDASQWPAWTDNFFWEVSDDERAALEAAELDRLCDIVDSPDPRQVSPIELSMLAAGMAIG